MRIGLGFDTHRFTKKKKSLLLGGVNIDCGFGIEAVSDGDIILHAICDALLGASSLGDIGDYFPPQGKKSQGLKSADIAKFVLEKVKKKYLIVNIDITVVADKPPLAKYKKKMVDYLYRLFGISVNIKIKSKERLNILGTDEGIICFAIASLEGKNKLNTEKE